jgi:hypothetical protein
LFAGTEGALSNGSLSQFFLALSNSKVSSKLKEYLQFSNFSSSILSNGVLFRHISTSFRHIPAGAASSWLQIVHYPAS